MRTNSKSIKKLLVYLLAFVVAVAFVPAFAFEVHASDFSLETNKTEYAYGESIKVKASGTSGSWVGMYDIDATYYGNNYYYKYNVKEANGVFTSIQSKTKGPAAGAKVDDGTYKIVIFENSGDTTPIESLTKTIRVARKTISQITIREPGCVTLGLEYVVYEDNTGEYREIPTLGGHDWNEPQHIDGTATHKLVCKRDETHQKIVPCEQTNAKIIKAANVNEAGAKEYFCDVCSSAYTVEIARLKRKPSLGTTVYVYNGTNRKPSVSAILDANGKVLSNKFYTITRPSKSVTVGAYTVTVAFKEDYSGTYKLTYKINPKAISLKSVVKGTGSFTAKWDKGTKPATGYQLAYSTNQNFKNVKHKIIKKLSTTLLKVKNLKAKKKYFIKIRTYKTVNDKKYYSTWSKTKTVVTK